MKKLTAFIMLLLHMNFFMFLPQCEETDYYDANGQQADDINSVVEYVRVVLGYDKTADDEDDDSGNNFTITKSCDYFFQQQVAILDIRDLLQRSNRGYNEYIIPALLCTCNDIISPPPEA
jgi:hypothetical protein